MLQILKNIFKHLILCFDFFFLTQATPEITNYILIFPFSPKPSGGENLCLLLRECNASGQERHLGIIRVAQRSPASSESVRSCFWLIPKARTSLC